MLKQKVLGQKSFVLNLKKKKKIDDRTTVEG